MQDAGVPGVDLAAPLVRMATGLWLLTRPRTSLLGKVLTFGLGTAFMARGLDGRDGAVAALSRGLRAQAGPKALVLDSLMGVATPRRLRAVVSVLRLLRSRR